MIDLIKYLNLCLFPVKYRRSTKNTLYRFYKDEVREYYLNTWLNNKFVEAVLKQLNMEPLFILSPWGKDIELSQKEMRAGLFQDANWYITYSDMYADYNENIIEKTHVLKVLPPDLLISYIINNRVDDLALITARLLWKELSEKPSIIELGGLLRHPSQLSFL